MRPFGDAAAASSSTASTTAAVSTASTTTPTYALPLRALSSAKAWLQNPSENTRAIVIARANSRDCRFDNELEALGIPPDAFPRLRGGLGCYRDQESAGPLPNPKPAA